MKNKTPRLPIDIGSLDCWFNCGGMVLVKGNGGGGSWGGGVNGISMVAIHVIWELRFIGGVSLGFSFGGDFAKTNMSA